MSKPFKGVINVDIRDSEPDWAPFEPPKAPDGAPNVLYIVLDDVGFSAMSCYGGPIETPNIDRIAAERRPLHAVAHDRALLADALLPPDRAQPHAQQHGLHHRGGDRLPERERHDPARERDALRDPRRAGLEHLHGRQVAPLPDRRDEPRLDAAQLADRPRLRALVRVPRRRDEPVVSGPRLRQPPGRPAEHAGRGLPPHRRHHRQGARVHPGREGDRAREAVLPLLRARRLPRAAPRAEGVDRQVQGPVRHGLRGDARADARPPEEARASSRPTPSCRRSTRSARPRRARARTASRSRCSTSPAPGTRSNDEEKRCSPAWPRSTPGSSRTPTTTSGACSTTSRRTASSRTR